MAIPKVRYNGFVVAQCTASPDETFGVSLRLSRLSNSIALGSMFPQQTNWLDIAWPSGSSRGAAHPPALQEFGQHTAQHAVSSLLPADNETPHTMHLGLQLDYMLGRVAAILAVVGPRAVAGDDTCKCRNLLGGTKAKNLGPWSCHPAKRIPKQSGNRAICSNLQKARAETFKSSSCT